MFKSIKQKRKMFFYEFYKFVNKTNGIKLLRKFNQLENSTINNDIDILVPRCKQKFTNVFFNSFGFKKQVDSYLLNIYLYGAKPHIHYINKELNLHFDCVEQLISKSLHNVYIGSVPITHWIPLDKRIQELAICTENVYNNNLGQIKTLSKNVELVHLLAHIIFDKRGRFETYYSKRILTLYREIDNKELENLLELVFFKFTPNLLKILDSGSTKDLFTNFINFKEY